MWKHDNLDEVQRGLLEKRIISIGGEVNVDMALYVREALLRLTAVGSPDITVIITSHGGLADIGLDIYDALCFYSGKKTGVVVAYAESMAAVILQACDERIATKHAHIHIHHITRTDVKLDTLRDPQKTTDLIIGMEETQNFIYDVLCSRTGRSIDEIRTECAKDKHMTSKQAKVFGLIDEIAPNDFVEKTRAHE